MAADTCELRATRQKVKASAICFVLPSRLPLELGGEGSADIGIGLCQPIFVSVARFHSRMDHGTEKTKLDVLFSLSPGLTVAILKP